MKKSKGKVKNKIKKNKNKSGFKRRFARLPLYLRVIIIVISSIVLIGCLVTGGIFLYINSINKTINSLTTSEVENILHPIESSRNRLLSLY